MSKPRQKGLGRGLDALLERSEPAASEGPGTVDRLTTLPLDRLQPGRYQPRTRMDESSLEELAASLRSHGMMQPVVVRPVGPARWEIIAGERRFRAARLAELDEIPVLVRDVPDAQALQLALIENIQREDLNPLEEAQAIRRLLDEFGFSHEQAAEAIGRSRSATSNLLRLLNLAAPVQTMLLAGDLDMGHARALLPLEAAHQIMLAQQISERRLSVREAERLVQRTLDAQAQPADAPRTSTGATSSGDLARMERHLSDLLAAPVSIRANAKGRGKMTIGFGSLDEFQGVIDRLGLGEEA